LHSFNQRNFLGTQNERIQEDYSFFQIPILFACLLVDAANKGLQLNTKPFLYLGEDGKVHQSALHTDVQHSKKQNITSISTFESMVIKQLTEEGVSRINGGGCDKFAEGEMNAVMNLIDEMCNQLWENGFRESLEHNGSYGMKYACNWNRGIS
jgi:hypothetical protein